jgi:hypothetical protein
MIRSRFEWVCCEGPWRPSVGRAADGGTVTRKFEAMMNDLVGQCRLNR